MTAKVLSNEKAVSRDHRRGAGKNRIDRVVVNGTAWKTEVSGVRTTHGVMKIRTWRQI